MDLCESVLLGDYKDENPTLKTVDTLKIQQDSKVNKNVDSGQCKPLETFLKPISPHDTPRENALKSPLCYYSENFRKHYQMAVNVPVDSRQNLEGEFETVNNQPRDELKIEDTKSSDKGKTLINDMKFDEVLGRRIIMSKIKLDVFKTWIVKKVFEILNVEDAVVVEYIMNELKESDPDPRKMQINLTGFLNGECAQIFMRDLWTLLDNAQNMENGIPAELGNNEPRELETNKTGELENNKPGELENNKPGELENDTPGELVPNLPVMEEEESIETRNVCNSFVAPVKVTTDHVEDTQVCHIENKFNDSVANIHLSSAPLTRVETTVEAAYEDNESIRHPHANNKTIIDTSYKIGDESRRDFMFSNSPPECIACASSTFENRFTKGCKWSCDGTKLLTAADDNIMRIFSTMDSQDCKPAVKIKEGECVYDFSWLPGRDVFASTGRYQPIHLWCGDSGKLIGTYRCFDQYDELTHSFSVAFNRSGEKLYSGLKNQVRIFDTSVPGRDCDVHVTSRKQELGQRGIISCIAVNPELPVYAAGSYNRSLGLYSTTRGNLLCLLQGQTGGVTQVSFSQDGSKLYSGARKDSEIICWDLRQPGQILYTVNRRANSNQRIQFDLSGCGRYLVSGGTDGCVLVWDVARAGVGALQPLAGYLLHPDCVNGVAFHPEEPLVATSSGQRHQDAVCSDSEEDDQVEVARDCSVKIWRF